MKIIIYSIVVILLTSVVSCVSPIKVTEQGEQRSVAQVADKSGLSEKTHLTQIISHDQFSLLAQTSTGVVRQGETISDRG